MPEDLMDYEDILSPNPKRIATNRSPWGWPKEDDEGISNPWWFGHFGDEQIESVKARITGPSIVRTGRDLLVDVDLVFLIVHFRLLHNGFKNTTKCLAKTLELTDVSLVDTVMDL